LEGLSYGMPLVLLAAALALHVPFAPSTATLKGQAGETLTVVIPPKFHIGPMQPLVLTLEAEHTQITISWTANDVDASVQKALDRNVQKAKKEGRFVGNVKVGPYSGGAFRYQVPKSAQSISYHASLVSRANHLSISYVDIAGSFMSPAKAKALFLDILKTAKIRPAGK